MTPSPQRSRQGRGFTLLEVMAAVLVLGLLYTVLAEAAMRGLRSEGIDRRRAEASLLADRQLADVEAMLDASGGLPPGVVETEEPPYAITLEVAPEPVLGLLPPELADEVLAERDPQGISLLGNDRIESRVQRITVRVEWDEAGDTQSVERTTWGLDRSDLAAFFPDGAGEDAAASGETPDAEIASRDRRGGGQTLGSALSDGVGGRGSASGGRGPTRGRGSGGPGAASPASQPAASGGSGCDRLPVEIRAIAREHGLC